MVFDWNEEKNTRLKERRGVGFERIVLAVGEGRILDVLEHPNEERYKGQILIIVELDGYAYVVPAVRKGEYWFLKTVFPGRKYTDRYLPGARRKK